MSTTVASVSELRAELWDAGFRPVPVFNHDASVASPGKQPLGDKWQLDARQNPPFCATSPAVKHALNTGILADGLQPIDLDIDDPGKARRCRALAISMLGDAPTRTRQGSPRSLMLYRAAAGEPVKRALTGRGHTKDLACKIEVLGRGQQFVAFGRHHQGADLQWFPDAPGHALREALPVVTEDAIQAFLEACAPILDAPMPARSNGHDHAPGEPQADTLRIAAALASIPNIGAADWEHWNRVGMAVWRATGGSTAGWEAFNAWSARNRAHDPAATRARWDHYATSPPTSIGAGTIFHMAAEAEQRTKQENDTREDPPPHPGGNRRRRADPGEFVWPVPLDFLTDPNGASPELRHEHIPLAINDFVFDTAGRMGVDPAAVALASIVALASVATDDWKLQPKRFDHTWTESPRLWAAILGDPSILKTPVINAATRPIDKLDTEARIVHAEAMRIYKQQVKLARADKSGETPDPVHPRLDRYLIEGTTMEAISEILRDDEGAHQRAPARKVLSRHNEMGEFFANLDRYQAGKGGGDRGAYLRLYDGGPYTFDRIIRGTFSVPNWSACFLGAMQPGPIQKIAKNASEDGMLQRFLFIVPGPQTPGIDRPPLHGALARYSALFPAMAALRPSRTSDGRHIQAVALHNNAHQHREMVEAMARALARMPDTDARLQAAFGKWPGMFARLALTFHLIEVADARATNNIGPVLEVISEQTAQRAAAFMLDIVYPHLMRADAMMFASTQTGHAKWIAGHILAHHYERITSRDITRAYGALRAPECRAELATVMDSLVTIGWLEPMDPNNPLKQVNTWAVNPAVHILFAEKAERDKAQREQARKDLAVLFATRQTKQANDDD